MLASLGVMARAGALGRQLLFLSVAVCLLGCERPSHRSPVYPAPQNQAGQWQGQAAPVPQPPRFHPAFQRLGFQLLTPTTYEIWAGPMTNTNMDTDICAVPHGCAEATINIIQPHAGFRVIPVGKLESDPSGQTRDIGCTNVTELKKGPAGRSWSQPQLPPGGIHIRCLMKKPGRYIVVLGGRDASKDPPSEGLVLRPFEYMVEYLVIAR